MKSSDDEVAKLESISGVAREKCANALRRKRGDVEAALRELIASGDATSMTVDAELATDAHFGLIQVRQMREALKEKTPQYLRIMRITPAAHAASIQRLTKMLTGKAALPAEILAVGKTFREMMGRIRKKNVAPAKPRRIRFGPFPMLTLEAGGWCGEDVLASWRGFQSRGGAYTSRDRKKPGGGKVKVVVSACGGRAQPRLEQAAAYGYLKKNEAAVCDAVVGGVYREYEKLRRRYGRDLMPAIKDKSELRNVMGLGIVHVPSVAKDGQAYVGFECGCDWDAEHGLGVLTHKGRVVQVGYGEVAFEEALAVKDGGKGE